MPDALVNVVRSGTGAKLLRLAADLLVPLCLLKVPNGAGEEAGSHEIEQTGGEDKEDLQPGGSTTPESIHVTICEEDNRDVGKQTYL